MLQFGYDLTHVPARTPVTVRYVPPTFDAFDYTRRFLNEGVQLIPVALVAHLMARSGETMRRIGFDASRPRYDVGLAVLLVTVTVAASVGALALSDAVDLPIRPLIGVNADAHMSAIVLLLFSSAVAGITEETIVNGYMITRLEDLGSRASYAVAASAGLRATYHLYQGWSGFTTNLVVGLIAGAIFVRTRRVMPLVIAHFANDVVAFGVDYFWADRPAWLL